jgi:hypothetical protein
MYESGTGRVIAYINKFFLFWGLRRHSLWSLPAPLRYGFAVAHTRFAGTLRALRIASPLRCGSTAATQREG